MDKVVSNFKVKCENPDQFFNLIDKFKDSVQYIAKTLVLQNVAQYIKRAQYEKVAEELGVPISYSIREKVRHENSTLFGEALSYILMQEEKVREGGSSEQELSTFDLSCLLHFSYDLGEFLVTLDTTQQDYADTFVTHPFVVTYEYHEDAVSLSDEEREERRVRWENADLQFSTTLYDSMPMGLVGKRDVKKMFKDSFNKKELINDYHYRAIYDTYLSTTNKTEKDIKDALDYADEHKKSDKYKLMLKTIKNYVNDLEY